MCCSEIDRVSSGGAVAKMSPTPCGGRVGSANQVTNAVMPGLRDEPDPRAVLGGQLAVPLEVLVEPPHRGRGQQARALAHPALGLGAAAGLQRRGSGRAPAGCVAGAWRVRRLGAGPSRVLDMGRA